MEIDASFTKRTDKSVRFISVGVLKIFNRRLCPFMAGFETTKLAALFILSLVLVIGVARMARSGEYICSPMRGVLVASDGTAAADMVVTRQWFWRGKRGEESTSTDKSGAFAFSEVPAKKGLFGFLPTSDLAELSFYVELPGGPFEFLNVFHDGLKLNGETKGKDFNVKLSDRR
jgi:hypothetical protein